MGEILLEDVRIARAAIGDSEVAECLLLRVHPRVLQVVSAAVGSRPERDDLVQACLCEVLSSLGKFKGVGSLESWAGQVSYRVVMRKLARERRRERTLTTVAEEPVSETKDPEQELMRARIWEQLRGLLDELKLEHRLALMLHIVHGYTVAEIAEFSEVSVNTVKYRLKTGLRALREQLEGQWSQFGKQLARFDDFLQLDTYLPEAGTDLATLADSSQEEKRLCLILVDVWRAKPHANDHISFRPRLTSDNGHSVIA